MDTATLARFTRKFTVDANGCWVWTAAVESGGYGHMNVGGRAGKMMRAHRLSYEHYIGPIPAGLDLDHLCRVRRCVNPAHLEAVTRRVNLLRGETLTAACAAATHCPQGHPYDGENTYVRTDAGREGQRQCKACNRDKNRARGNVTRNAAKTHCPKGHPYDAENTRMVQHPNGHAFRMCRTCRPAATR